MNLFTRRFRRSAGGFTLVELLITVGALGLVGGIAYAVLLDGFNQFVRNISLNKSDNSLRYSIQRLKRDITIAVQAPTLVSYDPASSKPLSVVTASAGALTSAAGIRLIVNQGPAYCLTAAGSSSDSLATSQALPVNTLSFRLWRHVPTGSNGTDPAPQPIFDAARSGSGDYSHNDRLMFLSPRAADQPSNPPWAATTQEITTGATVPQGAGTYTQRTFKPGRRLASLSVGSATSNSFDVTLEDLRSLSPAQNLASIVPNNSAYLVHEIAYAVYANKDAGGNVVSRELRYFPHADDPATYFVISSDLDPNPKEQMRNDAGALILDAGGNPQPVQPFTISTGDSNTVRVNLPIRALDYARVIAERGVAPGATNVSSEFNVSISSKPYMGFRNNIKN